MIFYGAFSVVDFYLPKIVNEPISKFDIFVKYEKKCFRRSLNCTLEIQTKYLIEIKLKSPKREIPKDYTEELIGKWK